MNNVENYKLEDLGIMNNKFNSRVEMFEYIRKVQKGAIVDAREMVFYLTDEKGKVEDMYYVRTKRNKEDKTISIDHIAFQHHSFEEVKDGVTYTRPYWYIYR